MIEPIRFTHDVVRLKMSMPTTHTYSEQLYVLARLEEAMRKRHGKEDRQECRQRELLPCMMEATLTLIPSCSASQTLCLNLRGTFPDSFRQHVQLKEAKRKRRKEEERERRRQREELARIKEAEAQRTHEAALAAIHDKPPEELAGALKPPDR